jgi:hypothetical protein
MTKPEKGLPALCTNILPNAMSVLPAPHSAMTFALRAICQRLLTPIMARDCAGYGRRNILESAGERSSSASCKGGYESRIRCPNSVACICR